MLATIEAFPEEVRTGIVLEAASRWLQPAEKAPEQEGGSPVEVTIRRMGVGVLPTPVVFMLCGLWCKQNDVSVGTFIRDWTDPKTKHEWSVVVRPTVRPYGIVSCRANAKALDKAEEAMEQLSSMLSTTRRQIEALETDLPRATDPNTRAHMQGRLDNLTQTLAKQTAEYSAAQEVVNDKQEWSWVFRLDKPLEITVLDDDRISREDVLRLPLHATLDDLAELTGESGDDDEDDEDGA